MKVCCDFLVEKETEKAVYCQVKFGCCQNVEKYKWLPKSACEIQEFIQTVNALGEPATFGKRVISIEAWLLKK